MRRRSDFPHEMPGELPPNDALAPFAEEVRFAVSGPPPVPSMALAAVLTAGFSGVSPTEKGDLLATAASNVHGPAPQAAGLPNWKEEANMPVTGILAALLAKLAGAGTAAKGALAGVTAVTTMAMAGGAAGVLPGPAQSLVASAVNAATPFEFPGADDPTAILESVTGSLPQLPVPVPALPATPSASASAGAQAGTTSGSATPSASGLASAKAAAPAITPTIPGMPSLPNLPQVSIPPAVSGLVNGLPACVKNLIPAGGTPDPTKLAAQIPGCITQVLGTASLPPQVATCVASVLGTIGGASGMSAAAVPSVGSLNVSSCVPMDTSKCVSNMLSLLATVPNLSGGGLPNLAGGGLPSLESLPGLTNVTGCVPMNIPACLTSISASAGTGTTPKFDLSTCVPAALPTAGLPGVGSLPGLGGLPGLSGALPFLGI